MNRHETEHRAVKVAGLVHVIERLSAFQGRPILAVEVLGWDDTHWTLAAFTAGITIPSKHTRAHVVARLADRDALVSALNERRL